MDKKKITELEEFSDDELIHPDDLFVCVHFETQGNPLPSLTVSASVVNATPTSVTLSLQTALTTGGDVYADNYMIVFDGATYNVPGNQSGHPETETTISGLNASTTYTYTVQAFKSQYSPSEVRTETATTLAPENNLSFTPTFTFSSTSHELKVTFDKSLDELGELDTSGNDKPNGWWVRMNTSAHSPQFSANAVEFSLDAQFPGDFSNNKTLVFTHADFYQSYMVGNYDGIYNRLIGHSCLYEIEVKAYTKYDNNVKKFSSSSGKQWCGTDLDLSPAFIWASSSPFSEDSIEFHLSFQGERRAFNYYNQLWHRDAIDAVEIKVFILSDHSLVRTLNYTLDSDDNLIGEDGVDDVPAIKTFGQMHEWQYRWIKVDGLPSDTRYYIQVKLSASVINPTPEEALAGKTQLTNVSVVSDSRYADLTNYHSDLDGNFHQAMFVNDGAVDGEHLELATLPAEGVNIVNVECVPFEGHGGDHRFKILFQGYANQTLSVVLEAKNDSGDWVTWPTGIGLQQQGLFSGELLTGAEWATEGRQIRFRFGNNAAELQYSNVWPVTGCP